MMHPYHPSYWFGSMSSTIFNAYEKAILIYHTNDIRFALSPASKFSLAQAMLEIINKCLSYLYLEHGYTKKDIWDLIKKARDAGTNTKSIEEFFGSEKELTQ